VQRAVGILEFYGLASPNAEDVWVKHAAGLRDNDGLSRDEIVPFGQTTFDLDKYIGDCLAFAEH
jgi:hypothetical protein